MANKLHALLPLAAGFALAGCVSFGEKPPPLLLTLSAAQTVPADADRTTTAGNAITILVPAIPQSLQTLRVPVQASPTTIAYLKDAQWVEQPNKLFERLLAETVAARTGRVVLDPRQSTLDPGTRLGGTLQSFGLDATSGQVIVTYDAALARDGGARVETRRFTVKAPSSDNPQAVAAALNGAANTVAAQVADWIK